MMVAQVLDEVFFQLLMCLLVSDMSMHVNIFFKCTMSSTMIRFDIVTTVIKTLVRVDPDGVPTARHEEVLQWRDGKGGKASGPVHMMEGEEPGSR